MDDESQRELKEFIEQESAKSQIQNAVHSFTSRCWETCISNAKSNQLDKKETACLQNCVERFIDASVHVVKRLQNSQH
ncbi:Mitochondrial import inner membrane translocase subunit tim8 [Coemansia sp. RSA 1358]|uniref:Mitochondrial import inner membrane translocase subunit n=1 Tax=Coemansia umbellata TaxID=1424467 RepID=A0ABQ8PFE4_9FUNG|nr:mitochondrial import inner membrane translocase subunit TIM8 [Coemansia spiralis]KAJ1988073.1 Mitochondrial import inner membrane translocase subunit tim8 [Coemansia umbellata]KAJ2619543.1 Mitochondrial import inner membrane translocase subunit tim8 [Coemansia sp. RSA 1358]